jgi:hypothetical protein
VLVTAVVEAIDSAAVHSATLKRTFLHDNTNNDDNLAAVTLCRHPSLIFSFSFSRVVVVVAAAATEAEPSSVLTAALPRTRPHSAARHLQST